MEVLGKGEIHQERQHAAAVRRLQPGDQVRAVAGRRRYAGEGLGHVGRIGQDVRLPIPVALAVKLLGRGGLDGVEV